MWHKFWGQHDRGAGLFRVVEAPEQLLDRASAYFARVDVHRRGTRVQDLKPQGLSRRASTGLASTHRAGVHGCLSSVLRAEGCPNNAYETDAGAVIIRCVS